MHPKVLNSSGVVSAQSTPTHSSAIPVPSSSSSKDPEPESSFAVCVSSRPRISSRLASPEKAPERDLPTLAKRPDATIGLLERRMFCTTFVKFVVPRNETVCLFFKSSVAMNIRCFTEGISSTSTRSFVVWKKEQMSCSDAEFSAAMFANRNKSSKVATTGKGGCVAARVFACKRLGRSTKVRFALENDSASPSSAFFTVAVVEKSSSNSNLFFAFSVLSDCVSDCVSDVSVSTTARGVPAMSLREVVPGFKATSVGAVLHRLWLALPSPQCNRRATNPRASHRMENDFHVFSPAEAACGAAERTANALWRATRGTEVTAMRSMACFRCTQDGYEEGPCVVRFGTG